MWWKFWHPTQVAHVFIAPFFVPNPERCSSTCRSSRPSSGLWHEFFSGLLSRIKIVCRTCSFPLNSISGQRGVPQNAPAIRQSPENPTEIVHQHLLRGLVRRYGSISVRKSVFFTCEVFLAKKVFCRRRSAIWRRLVLEKII